MRALFLVVVALLGALSMGLQLLASRVFAPFFGNSIFVWASLITVFLAAFSTGSFVGGAISARPVEVQRARVRWIMALSSATLLFCDLAGYRVCDFVDERIESLLGKLLLASSLLYFLPVAGMSALLPVCVKTFDERSAAAGRSSGIINGVSTLGNIAGVLGSSLFLIPHFGVRALLHFWTAFSVLLYTALWFICFASRSRSPSSAQKPV